jgi:hypothetical protein
MIFAGIGSPVFWTIYSGDCLPKAFGSDKQEIIIT